MTRLDNESVETGGLDRIRALRDSCSGCTPPTRSQRFRLRQPSASLTASCPSLAGTTKICSTTPYFSGNFWQETLDLLQPSGSCLIDQPSMPTGRRADGRRPTMEAPVVIRRRPVPSAEDAAVIARDSTETLMRLPAWQSLAEKDRIFPRLQTSSDLLTEAPPPWDWGPSTEY